MAFHLFVFLIIILLYASIFTFNGIGTVTSDSMAPNLNTGDVVVLSATDPLVPFFNPTIRGELNSEANVQTFNRRGSVIAFRSEVVDTPIVHRVRYEADEGENWVAGMKAQTDSAILQSRTCDDTRFCPAPRSGYITQGDNNTLPDQLQGVEVVSESDIIGIAHFRIPVVGTPLVGYYQNGNATSDT